MASSQIWILASYVIIEAIRTRFFWVMIILLLIGMGSTLFIGSITLIETQAIQSSWLGAFLRLAAVYIVSLFVITSMVREFHEHSIYLWLSIPMRRSTYLLGKLSGFMIVALLTAILYGVSLLKYVSWEVVSIWTFSLGCELFIVSAASLLCVLTFPQTIQAFSMVLGFYVLSRSITAIQLMIQGPLWQNVYNWTDFIVNQLVGLLARFLPPLSQFTQSEWLVYATGNLENLWIIIVQTAIYVTLLVAMSLFDWYRKNL